MLLSTATVVEPAFTFVSPVQRLILKTDGTLTDLLETLHDEKLRVVVLGQTIAPAERAIESLALAAGENILHRRVVIRGQRSGDAYVHATSCVALDRLDGRVRHGLLTTSIGLGQLWKRNRVETFKEVLDSGLVSAGGMSSYFDIGPEAPLLFRRVRASSDGKPVTLISEHIRYPVL